MITHLAFYVGWPNAMSAVNRVKAPFSRRRADRARNTSGLAAATRVRGSDNLRWFPTGVSEYA